MYFSISAFLFFLIENKKNKKQLLNLFIIVTTLHALFNIFALASELKNYDLFLKINQLSVYTETLPKNWFLDNLSLSLMTLTSIISFLCYVWLAEPSELKIDSVLCIKLIEFCMHNAFSTSNLVYFYVFFELSAIPLLFLIGRRGPSFRKIKAAQYFLGYTLFGSVFLLSTILFLNYLLGSVNFFFILENINSLSQLQQTVIWFGFFISFLVKIPTAPFHLWLLEAHVEAPTVGSVILAAILLKIGGYGMIRFCVQLLPEITNYYYPVAYVLGLGSLLFSTLSALCQVDLKRIIAYSSIAHMNASVLCIFSLNTIAYKGAVVAMLSHGLVSAAMFFLAGIVYKMYHTKNLALLGGLGTLMPKFTFFFIFFTISNIGFPGTFNFTGELLSLVGVHESSPLVSYFFLLKTGILFIFFMFLVNKVCFTEVEDGDVCYFSDLTYRETGILGSLGVLTVLFGVYPNAILVFI